MMQDIDSWLNTNLKNETGNKTMVSVTNTVEQKQKDNPIFKHVIPEFLYKPPFGHPRNINVPFLRTLSKNPYIMSIIRLLMDEAVSTDWDIVPKEGVEMTDELLKQKLYIKEFLKNPNDDDESFNQILRKLVLDFVVLDSACIIKTYNRFGELLQFRVIDGGTIVKNPDQHGRIGPRDDFIFDGPQFLNGIKYTAADAVNQFKSQYAERAAYFQFSNTLMTSMPIPFGKKEIIYMMQYPSTDSVYSFCSPVQAATDIALSLIFGSKFNLDFYMNGNAPEGIIQLAGATNDQLLATKERIENAMYTPKDEYGIARRVGYRLPITNAADAKFVPFNFSSKEMEIIAQQEWFSKILWACMGVTPAEMGFDQHSNKATDENQSKVAARKGVKPLLDTMTYYINRQIVAELPGGDLLEFSFDEFEIAEEKAKRELQQMEINMGIKTWQMVAEEEGIDINKLQKDKQEDQDFQMQMFGEEENTDQEMKSMNLDTLVEQIKLEIEKEAENLVNENGR